jgi:dihydroorotase
VAEYGMIGLQTAFSLALKAGLSLDTIVQKMSVSPRNILNVDVPVIGEGLAANFIIVDINAEWHYNRTINLSTSSNSPYLGQNLKGKVLLTCNNNHLFKSDN